MDLEKALARIIELEGELKHVNEQNDSLKITNESLQNESKANQEQIQRLKQMNMKYFERLTMETKTPPMNQQTPENDSKTEEPTSWDDFMNQW